MNDFTKPELLLLQAGVMGILADEAKPKLVKKLQEMMDNYCEHEKSGAVSRHVKFAGELHYQCKKCGGFYSE